jgi:hypothetical protein
MAINGRCSVINPNLALPTPSTDLTTPDYVQIRANQTIRNKGKHSPHTG